jgi:predicted RNase H-like HicB family nuclease
MMAEETRFPLGLEEGADGGFVVHALSVPGCTATAESRDAALAAFPAELSEWLQFLAAIGERVPAPDAELELAIDEWVETDAEIAEGESRSIFDADFVPLSDLDVQRYVWWLGELRGRLLRRIRPLSPAEQDEPRADGWSVARLVDELARAQWWTLSRLGSSPLGEVPDRTTGRLDTAMALVVQRFTEMPPEVRGTIVELDGETWTPRKVLRRLLALEWEMGRVVERLLASVGSTR